MKVWNIESILDGLSGRWTLDRQIVDFGTMAGTAVFEWSSPDRLFFKESGRLELLSGTSHAASRSYIYSRVPGGFSVWFDEPEPQLFHTVALYPDADLICGEATHLCGDDHYETAYRFLPDASFTIRHRVTGPRKDYVSITRYLRDERV